MKTLTLLQKEIHTGSLILVNAAAGYREDAQTSLVPVLESYPAIQMQRRAAVLLSNLMDSFHGWQHIVPVSGWRAYAEQQQIWDDSIRDSGLDFTQKYVALPGHSEHQTGLAIDLGQKQAHIDFIRPAFPYSGICQIFRDKAADYGFVERYPAGKEHLTGIAHEPWHFRYVGVPHAKIMVQNHLVLEEYLSFIKQYRYGQSAYPILWGGQEVLVSYLPASTGAYTCLEVDSTIPYSISGNNTDGFILTEWRHTHANKTKLRGA